MSIFKVILFSICLCSCAKKNIETKLSDNTNCYYQVKSIVGQKSITCRTLISREQCGLFLKDCDTNITGINCATNVTYYCR